MQPGFPLFPCHLVEMVSGLPVYSKNSVMIVKCAQVHAYKPGC
jgi:hypothetical protein